MAKSINCRNCEDGRMRPKDVSGLSFAYKDSPSVVMGASLEILTCDVCGDMRLDEETARALDIGLEESYKSDRLETQRAWIDAIGEHGLTQQELEQVLYVSPGYVSKLRTTKVASGATFRLLYLLWRNPEREVRLLGELDDRIKGIADRRFPIRRASSGAPRMARTPISPDISEANIFDPGMELYRPDDTTTPNRWHSPRSRTPQLV